MQEAAGLREKVTPQDRQFLIDLLRMLNGLEKKLKELLNK
jgi:hypothetical protein